jgi:hypothetical protein
MAARNGRPPEGSGLPREHRSIRPEQAEHEEGGAPASYASHDPSTPPGHGPFPTTVWCVGRAMHPRSDQSRSGGFGGLLEGLIETDACCDTLLVEGGRISRGGWPPERVTVGDGGHPRGADPILPGTRPRVRRVVGTTRPVRPRFGRECQMVLRTDRSPGRVRPSEPPG